MFSVFQGFLGVFPVISGVGTANPVNRITNLPIILYVRNM